MSSVFVDAGQAPTPESIGTALGPAADAWHGALAAAAARGVDVAWRYYRDGGWLARASRGGRTVAWLSVGPGLVKVAFYFAERHRALLVEDAGLPRQLRERIASTALVGRLLPVALELGAATDLPAFDELLRLKLAAS